MDSHLLRPQRHRTNSAPLRDHAGHRDPARPASTAATPLRPRQAQTVDLRYGSPIGVADNYQNNLICAQPLTDHESHSRSISAGLCVFSLTFSITQRAAVDQRGPMLAADSAQRDWAGSRRRAPVPVDVRANVPAGR